MFKVLADNIENFLNYYNSQLPEYCKNLSHKIQTEHENAFLQSSELQGQYLRFFSLLQKPKSILEIGCFMGFSAICLAEGLNSTGKLHTIELNPDYVRATNENIKSSPFKDLIHIHEGNALEIIPNLNETWDLVFIDADKVNYLNYLKLVLPSLAKNGVILADNMFQEGLIFDENSTNENVAAIRKFCQYVKENKSLVNITIPIRDGLMIIKKI